MEFAKNARIIGPDDAPLTGTAGSGVFAPYQGQTVTTVQFSDGDGEATGSDLSATIHWGDGSSSSGTLTNLGGGSYSVQGTHTYDTAGTYGGYVTMIDTGGQSATASYAATVVSLTSTTVTDASTGNTVTATGNTGNTLYFTPNDDGSGEISLTGVVAPATATAYGATQYEVLDADGDEVASGSLSSSPAWVDLPAPSSGEADTFTVESGTYVDGGFSVTNTVALTPDKMSASTNPITISLASITPPATSTTGSTIVSSDTGVIDASVGNPVPGPGAAGGACTAAPTTTGANSMLVTVTVTSAAKVGTSYTITVTDNVPGGAAPLTITVNVTP